MQDKHRGELRTPKHGKGKLRIGGNGSGGRPPDKFKAMCRALASSKEVERQVKDILARGSSDPMFIGALKWASEHGYGRPEQSVDVTSKGEKLPGVILLPAEVPDESELSQSDAKHG